MCGPSSVVSKYAWYLYVYMSEFLRICLLISAHILVLSARIQVCICRYPSPYLQVSTFVSKCIHLSICTFTVDLHVSTFVSECIPVSICLCPVCICICNLIHIQPNISPSASQANQIITQTRARARTHPRSLCCLFLRLHLRTAALPVQHWQLQVLEWLLDCACSFCRFPKKCCVCSKSWSTSCLLVYSSLKGGENCCQWFLVTWNRLGCKAEKFQREKVLPFLFR